MVNQRTIDLIKQFEGVRLRVYSDPVGILTVGVGHVVRPQDNLMVGQVITQQRADEFLRDDLKSAEKSVDKVAGWPLTDNQRGALVSFTFNAGAGNLRKLLKDGLAAIPQRLLLFNKARKNGVLVVLQGLTNRRKAEAALFVLP